MVLSHPAYTEYEVSSNSKVFCLWFTKSSVSVAELNLELKAQANYIKISPNFTYVISTNPSLSIFLFLIYLND